MVHATSSLSIDASAERLWDILTDLDRYRVWNPFIHYAAGRIEEGAVLDLVIASTLLRRRRMNPRVLKVRPPYGFRWRERLPVPGLLCSEYSFLLQINGPEGVRFVHTTTFGGLMAAGVHRWLGSSLLRRQEAMNRALKMRAETCRPRPRQPRWHPREHLVSPRGEMLCAEGVVERVAGR
jgi:hypothetical protein